MKNLSEFLFRTKQTTHVYHFLYFYKVSYSFSSGLLLEVQKWKYLGNRAMQARKSNVFLNCISVKDLFICKNGERTRVTKFPSLDQMYYLNVQLIHYCFKEFTDYGANLCTVYINVFLEFVCQWCILFGEMQSYKSIGGHVCPETWKSSCLSPGRIV